MSGYKPNPPLEELFDDELLHYGIKRRSGRYPWGSGDNPYQRGADFRKRVQDMKKSGMKESEIAEALGIKDSTGKPSSTKLRAMMSIAKDDDRLIEVQRAEALREKGLSLQKIAEEMGYKNDSSVRALLNQTAKFRSMQSVETANMLVEQLKTKPLLDVGVGVERELNISREMLDQALVRLEMEGYKVYSGRVDQLTNPGQKTTLKVLGPPGTEHKDIYNSENVKSVGDYISKDGGKTYEKRFTYPASLDSKRLMVRYAEDGGIEKDGLIELRRGVKDLSLGNSMYSQVRILVDDTKYIKGMAVYSDNMPDGVDIIFNTNKTKNVSKLDTLKDIKKDPDNPFGSSIKDAKLGGQYWYEDDNGNKKLGLINKCRDEGDWADWSKSLPSQVLSKQKVSLAKQQLKITLDERQKELDEIMSLTNPTVKKQLLKSFAEGCDSSAVHLNAAALPRSQHHVILPMTSIKETEVYAPNYNTGDKVALIRFPHGGTFEIPILTVNNNHTQSKKMIGAQAKDAVGINSKVAERLSGADFDGDSVLTIPITAKSNITSTKQLDGLIGYDPKVSYATEKRKNPNYTGKKGEEEYEYYNKYGQKVKIMANTQNEMGRISNLITDMTIQKASTEELARAVRHSMTVIDAEKHKLDYKTSYVENGIEALKRKYQTTVNPDGSISGGATTIISRAKGEEQVDKRQGSPKINIKGDKDYDPTRPEGALIYKTADDLYYPIKKYDKTTKETTLTTTQGKKITYRVDDVEARGRYEPVQGVDPKTGVVRFTNKAGDIEYKFKKRTQPSVKMLETDDAHTLVSQYRAPMEVLYANFANQMKSMANNARKEMVFAGKIEYNPNAKKTYATQVQSLEYKLNEALKNAPRERQALTIANSIVAAKTKANPDMDKGEIKKLKDREMQRARELVGAKRTPIEVSDAEWEAIQAGAISETKLIKILNNADIDVLREKAMPKQKVELSQSTINRIKAYVNRGYSTAQISAQLGISVSTVNKYK